MSRTGNALSKALPDSQENPKAWSRDPLDAEVVVEKAAGIDDPSLPAGRHTHQNRGFEMANRVRSTLSYRRRLARASGLLLISLMLSAILAACADLKSQPRDPGDKPFWERNEQRDD